MLCLLFFYCKWTLNLVDDDDDDQLYCRNGDLIICVNIYFYPNQFLLTTRITIFYALFVVFHVSVTGEDRR